MWASKLQDLSSCIIDFTWAMSASKLLIRLESNSKCFLGLLQGLLFVTEPGHLQTTCCLDWWAWATFSSMPVFKSSSQTLVRTGIIVQSVQEMSESDTVPLRWSVWGLGHWDQGESIQSHGVNVESTNISECKVESRDRKYSKRGLYTAVEDRTPVALTKWLAPYHVYVHACSK